MAWSDAAARLSVLEVDLGQLVANWRAIQSAVGEGRQVMPIVKANAYGHGAVRVALALEAAGAPRFAVAYAEEALELRRAGLRAPIMLLGSLVTTQLPGMLRLGLELTVGSKAEVEALNALARKMDLKAKVQLKIDTGMGRIGAPWDAAAPMLEAAILASHVEPVGVWSHFASSEDADTSATERQLSRFLQAITVFRDKGHPMPIRHIANSGAILQHPESHLDAVRPGILLYGILPAPALAGRIPVRPVLGLKSQISFVKQVEAGVSVGYNARWTASKPTWVGTVPLGYGDGYPRRMSQAVEVLIGGQRRPQIGTISMDTLLVDLGETPVPLGEPVQLIGRQGEQRITVEQLAEAAGTIPYEVLTRLNQRLPRQYLDRSTTLT